MKLSVGDSPCVMIGHGREQLRGSRDATDWFRGYRHSSSVSPPCARLEIQAQSQLDLPRRSHEAGRAKRWIRRTGHAIAEALRNRPEERCRPVDGVNGIDVRAIKQI